MPDSQNPEHVRKLISEFQLKGANLIPTVTGEIVPTVLVADLSVEKRATDRLAMGGVLGAASGAGKQNRLILENRAGSETLLILEKFNAITQAADTVEIVLSTGTSGAAGAAQWRDARLAGEPSGTTGRVAATAAVLGINQVIATDATAFDHKWIDLELIMPPGTQLFIQQQTQNVTLSVLFLWRERDLLPGD